MPWKWLMSVVRVRIYGALHLRFHSRQARGNTHTISSHIESLEQRLVLTPTSEEQLFVYLLNKIRHDPQAYDAAENLQGILDPVEARQPLAINADLFDSARFHAVEMANNNYFAHQSAVTGDWPNKMARDQGYDLPDFFTNNNNFVESLAAGNLYGNPADVIKLLIIDEGISPPGHRIHLLGIDSFNEQAREIGVGHGFNISSLYDHYWAAHITFSDPDDVFLTGVVYQDTNTDQAFGLNGGLAGVTVSIAGQALTTQTNAAGGWAIRVPAAGNYTLQVNGGSFVGTATTSVQVGTENREVDFTSGNSIGVIDFEVSSDLPNAPPVNSVPAGPLALQEDTPFSIAGLSIADPDAGTGTITVSLGVSHGTLNVATNVPNGVTTQHVTGNNSEQVVLTGSLSQINTTLANIQGVTYLAASNFSGADTLTVLSDDLGQSGTGGAMTDLDSVAILVGAVNDAPLNTVPAGPVSVVTNTPLTLSGLSFTDVDLGMGEAQVTLSVLHGALTLRTDVAGGLTAADLASNGTTSVTVAAPRSQILATLAAAGGLSYLSNNGYVGPDTLTMNTSDQGQSGNGPVGTDLDTVAILVQAVPTAPTITIPGSSVTSSKKRPVIVGTGATLTDPDSPTFSSGRLTVQISGGAQTTDKLTLNKVGTKTGQLNLRKNDVRLGKSVVGYITGGTGGSPLVVQFTTNVTLATVQMVLQNVTLRAARGRLLAGSRTISFVATDPTQLASTPKTREANVPG